MPLNLLYIYIYIHIFIYIYIYIYIYISPHTCVSSFPGLISVALSLYMYICIYHIDCRYLRVVAADLLKEMKFRKKLTLKIKRRMRDFLEHLWSFSQKKLLMMMMVTNGFRGMVYHKKHLVSFPIWIIVISFPCFKLWYVINRI